MAQDSTRFFSLGLGGRGCVSATIGDRLALVQTIGEVLAQIAQDSWAIKPIMMLKMRWSIQSMKNIQGRVWRRTKMIFVTWPRDLAGAMLW